MIFPERIVSINTKDKVLEVGPGGSPFHRSNVLLELQLSDEELARQRGFSKPLSIDKEIVYYAGGQFPFKDKEFDYVICSHVLEHIEEDDVPFFISELMRVANKGYLEFPTPYYDYLYNFEVHKTFTYLDDKTINYASKRNFNLLEFKLFQKFFYRTLELGEESILQNYQSFFFQGFEWFESINSQKVNSINALCFPIELIAKKPKTVKKSLKIIANELRFIAKRIIKVE